MTKVGAPNGTSRSDRYDRWFRYPAGFSASTLTKTFDSVGDKGASDMLFFDPFCGAGTVGTAALARGHRFAGIDAHPLIVELARAKLSPPDRPTEELVEVATEISEASKASIDQEAELVRRCFDPETLGVLCGMRAQINRQSRWKTHLTWALLGTLRDVSDKKVGWPYQRPGQSRQPVTKDARARFLKRAEVMAEDISEQPLSGIGRVRLGDSRSAKPWRELLDGDKADACITSPPYLNNFDYADATRLEVYFLGRATSWYELCERIRAKMMIATTQQSRAGVARRHEAQLKGAGEAGEAVISLVERLREERRSRARGKEYDRLVPSYFCGLRAVLEKLAPSLKPGAKCSWVVGDSAPYGVYIDTPKLIEILAEGEGFKALGSERIRQRGNRWVQNGSRHHVALDERIITLQKA